MIAAEIIRKSHRAIDASVRRQVSGGKVRPVANALPRMVEPHPTGARDVNLFSWQYFVNFNFSGGWYLTTSPLVTANWEAKRSSDTWTVPVGGGFGRVFRIGSLPPINAQIQAFYNVARPDSVGRWSARFQLQLMFPR